MKSGIKNITDDIAELFGRNTRISFETLGGMAMFIFKAASARWRIYFIVEQMFLLGVNSIPLVMFVSVFVGFITSLTFQAIMSAVHSSGAIMGRMIGDAVFLELGPALVGLILAGRIAAKISAEIGSMRVTDQLDAFECLCLNPMEYLIGPRIIACVLMGPVFFTISSAVALITSQIFSQFAFSVSPATFFGGVKYGFRIEVAIIGVLKVLVFSFINGLCGCYFGYYTTGGAVGVGKSTRQAVVASSVLILIANFVLMQLFSI